MERQLSWAELYYGIEWAIRIGALTTVPFRRTPAAARSWLLLIFFLPVPGLLLILAIGTPRLPRWRVARFEAFAPVIRDLATRMRGAKSREVPQVASIAEKLGMLPATGANSLEFLTDYPAAIDRLIADIDDARHHVRILTYIFADDATGQRVIDALARAVARGVACQALIDPVGSARWFRATHGRLLAAGVEARAALPLRILRGWTRRDMRNHRKLYLIDGAVGYVGSQNIVDADFRTGVTNRELLTRVTGPAVIGMEAVFTADWFLETEIRLDVPPADVPADVPADASAQVPAHMPTMPDGGAQLLVMPSGADYAMGSFQTVLAALVQQAAERITLVTPYFIPDETLLGALRTAVLRGVTVDLIVSAVVDQPLVHLAQCSYYDELLAAGIRIHRYRRYLLHAKCIAVDGQVGIVGSGNIDIRSFQLNEEISLMVMDRESMASLDTIVDRYRAESDPLRLVDWRRRGYARKLQESLARLMSPLL